MTRARHGLSALRRDERGASIVEFALVTPIFVMVMIGGLYLAMLGFTKASLRYAVEAGARCASIGSTSCSDNASIITYTKSQFKGTTRSMPSFAVSTATCGHVVSGSTTFVLDTGLTDISVPLSETACFP